MILKLTVYVRNVIFFFYKWKSGQITILETFLAKWLILAYVLGPVAQFRCTAWLEAAWAAGQRRRARDFVGKILE